ncbi:Crp/Fnr family transcriptional regulator [Kallotenue papyrolyticum]|uniref:Crp/Fnr family transcriptional regulator n=1 Tax=Kallotenue papyrolyticum TaxID=1325125 RepID=UPI00049297A2|nr:Crp/Fnr family transcriptional regulator [Kallotenue papyrolyticum]
MSQIVVVGMPPTGDALLALFEQGYRLTLVADLSQLVGDLRPAAALVCAARREPLQRLAAQVTALELPWIAWTNADDRALTLAAYSAGALAVLPASTPAPLVVRAVAQTLALATRARAARPAAVGRRSYASGAVIELEPEAVLQIEAGVIAQSILHRDGREGLLGLWGPGQIIIGHPHDACCLQLTAQTDTSVTIRPWHDLRADPDFPERLALRLRYLEAWAAAQARPYLDQRILGVLELLAEQFGVPHAHGLLIDVRVTHAQLAAAVGATRSTVTRILGELRERGVLTTLALAGGERVCLCRRHASDHRAGLRQALDPIAG